jgi:hypothetical protein
MQVQAVRISMRMLSKALAVVVLGGVALVPALLSTTLQKLSLDDMIRLSTTVVRAKVASPYSAPRGADIYTFYQLSILETLKAAGSTPSEVAVPGGSANGRRQLVEGAPNLLPGQEYVLFLWTSPSGLTQVIGLSQGLFAATTDASGNTVLARPAAPEAMLDENGQAVTGQAVKLRLSDLRSRIQKSAATK